MATYIGDPQRRKADQDHFDRSPVIAINFPLNFKL